MNEMPMGGGAAHAWSAAPAAFIGMWVAMMILMMLPSMLPTLWRYRRAVAATHSIRGARLGLATAIATGGYLFVWTVFGVAALPLSIALTRLAPVVTGMIVVIAGAWQFTAWKAHHLSCFRQAAPGRVTRRADAYTAWRHGIRLGLECARCCGNLMVIPLVFGTMDLRAMALVAAAITLERLAPAGERVARAVGVAAVVAGVFLIAKGGV